MEAEWAPDAVRAGNFIPERMWRCHNVFGAMSRSLNSKVIVGHDQRRYARPCPRARSNGRTLTVPIHAGRCFHSKSS